MEIFNGITDNFKDIKWDTPKMDFPFFQNFHPLKDEQDFIIMIVFIILLLLLILSQQEN